MRRKPEKPDSEFKKHENDAPSLRFPSYSERKAASFLCVFIRFFFPRMYYLARPACIMTFLVLGLHLLCDIVLI